MPADAELEIALGETDLGGVRLPGAGQVQIWWSRLPDGGLPAPTRAGLDGWLDSSTLDRLARMRRPEDQDRGRLGHGLLRRLLGAGLGVPPAQLRIARWCRNCGSTAHGKPYLLDPEQASVTDRGVGVPDGPGVPAVQLNLSHSGRVVVVALAGPELPVGVDVEWPRPVDWNQLRAMVFDDSDWAGTGRAGDPDRARFDAWARKEAVLKATGHGLSMPLHRVPVAAEPDPADRFGPGGWRPVLLPAAAGSETIDRGARLAPGKPIGLPDGADPVAGRVRALVRDLVEIADCSAAVAVLQPPLDGSGDPAAHGWAPELTVRRVRLSARS